MVLLRFLIGALFYLFICFYTVLLEVRNLQPIRHLAAAGTCPDLWPAPATTTRARTVTLQSAGSCKDLAAGLHLWWRCRNCSTCNRCGSCCGGCGCPGCGAFNVCACAPTGMMGVMNDPENKIWLQNNGFGLMESQDFSKAFRPWVEGHTGAKGICAVCNTHHPVKYVVISCISLQELPRQTPRPRSWQQPSYGTRVEKKCRSPSFRPRDPLSRGALNNSFLIGFENALEMLCWILMAGSSGRLTSCWNWCSKIEKKACRRAKRLGNRGQMFKKAIFKAMLMYLSQPHRPYFMKDNGSTGTSPASFSPASRALTAASPLVLAPSPGDRALSHASLILPSCGAC